MERHQQDVAEIATAVRRFYDRKEAFRVSHGSTNSTRPIASKGTNLVDTSKLQHVLKINNLSRTCLVEPNVPMDRLVEATLPHGLIPPVVMEFPGITVGGGYAGTSGESSSFKHGFFDQTINMVEMVLADGSVVTCSDSKRPDLFRGAAGAVGTLGVTTMVELQLVQAKRYVEATYHPVSSAGEAIERVQEAAENAKNDYVDGIIFSENQGAVITGCMTDDLPTGARPQSFSYAWDPWFYLHVHEKIESSGGPTVEYIPLPEYLFRYDRGGFWVARAAFRYFGSPFNRLTRWLLDGVCHTRMLYKALDASSQSKQVIVQDLALPYNTAEEFIHYCSEALQIYPLWLCPLKQSPDPSKTFHPHLTEYQSQNPGVVDGGGNDQNPVPLLNIGLWGQGPHDHQTFLDLNRHLESVLTRLRGMKWSYAHHYYTEQEFWSMYDRDWYEKLREKYHATTLPTVYEKICSKPEVQRPDEISWTQTIREMYPINGIWGMVMAVRSGAYLEARRSRWMHMVWPDNDMKKGE